MPRKLNEDQKKELQEKTLLFVKKTGCNIIRSGIDWWTIRMNNDNERIKELLNKEDKTEIITILNGQFYIKYFGVVAGSRMEVWHIMDWENKKQVGCVHIRINFEKKDKNLFTDIELVGNFMHCYFDKFNDILNYFHIDKNKRNIVSRIDFEFDFVGPTVKDFYEYENCKKLKENLKNSSKLINSFSMNENGDLIIPADEIYKIKEIIQMGESQTHSINEKDTYRGKKSERNEIYIYDKKLDILDKDKFKIKVGGEYIYKEYLDEKRNITRIEYKKHARSLREMKQNSINEIIEKIEDLAIDYIEDNFDLDFRNILIKKQRYIGFDAIIENYREKIIGIIYTDKLINKIIEKKASRSTSMLKAYAESLEVFTSRKEVFSTLYGMYGVSMVDSCVKYNMSYEDRLAVLF